MKKNFVMKVLTMIAAVTVLTGCASQSAEDISAIINDGTQVVETVGNGNADKTEKGVKATEDAGTGSGINSTTAEKGSAAPTAEEDAPEATTEPETTAQPEATTQPKATAQPKATTQPETTAQPKATAKPQTTAQPETTTEPEAAKQPETAAEPSTTAQPQTTTQPEPTPEPAPAQPPAAGDTTPACNHTITMQSLTETFPENCTGRCRLVEICSKCGYIQKTIQDTGIVEVHAYGEAIWAAYPTCSTPGEQYHICKNCGKEEAHYFTPAIADNHNYVAVSSSVVEAGCPNSQRLVDVTYVCSLCNASYSEWEIEVATEHPDSNGDGECDYCHCSVGTPVQQPESVPEPMPEPVQPAPEQQPESVPEQQPESVQQPEPAPEQQPVDNTQSGTE